jgi:hypothetical protein
MNDKGLQEIVTEFVKGGWIVAVLGAMGASARLMLSPTKHHWVVWVKKITAGGIVGVLTYFALYPIDIDPMYKAVMFSISGAIASELVEFVTSKLVHRFLK